MQEKSSYIGKYVCYDQLDGGACWGRIKDEAKVNTMKGEKEVFILENRWVRYASTMDRGRFRVFYPDASNSPARRIMIQGKDGLRDPEPGEVQFEVYKVRGDSTLRKEMINLEKDIIDAEELIRRVGVEVIFRAVLAGRDAGLADCRSAMEIGLQSLLHDEDFKRVLSAVIDGASGKRADETSHDGSVAEGGGND
jgi:hypothetical protein